MKTTANFPEVKILITNLLTNIDKLEENDENPFRTVISKGIYEYGQTAILAGIKESLETSPSAYDHRLIFEFAETLNLKEIELSAEQKRTLSGIKIKPSDKLTTHVRARVLMTAGEVDFSKIVVSRNDRVKSPRFD
jgi:hypothetical protein